MKTHHSVALALLGWYLMVPPQSDKGQFIRTAALSRWLSVRSFDSANACEDWLADSLRAAKSDENKADDEIKKQFKKFRPNEKPNFTDAQAKDFMQATTFEVAMEQAHCIATDDPRLKER